MKLFAFFLLAALAAPTVLGDGAPAPKPALKPVPKPAPLVPASEWKMIRQIAVNYDLSDDATWLLAAVRRHENGRPGLEFGVGGPMNSGHKAHRYRDGVKSFYVQGYWAAGTIRKHYTGDVVAFGQRYNPANAATWSTSVTSLIRRLKAENNYQLPGAKPEKRVIDLP